MPFSYSERRRSLRFIAIVERVHLAFIGRIEAAVPHDHLTGAVLLGRDDALERAIVEGMIFDWNSQALDFGVQRRTVRNRPGLEHAVELQAKVVVQASSGVLLHHEEQRAAPLQRFLWRRLRRGFERALLGVVR